MMVIRNIEFFSCLILLQVMLAFTLLFLKNKYDLKLKIKTRVKDFKEMHISVLFIFQ